jgi:hypothetical protein
VAGGRLQVASRRWQVFVTLSPLHLVIFKREGVGVEPTAAGSAPPATDFEDQGAHRDTSPPIQSIVAEGERIGEIVNGGR